MDQIMADATIRDVARRAKVSVASVSRVINGLGNVGDATRGKVEEAIAGLGYVPHAAARSLSLARTHSIGVVLPDLHGEFFSEVVRGMDGVAGDRGYLLLLSSMHTGARAGLNALRAMRGRVDGALVMAPHLSEDELAATLPPGVPVVLLNTRAGMGLHRAITLDNRAGAAAVARHLIALGHRRLVHIRGPDGNADAAERAEAFATVVGHCPDARLEVVRGDFSEASGEACVTALLKAGHRFDAIFAANDNMALGAMHVLRTAGIAVPGQVAVAGFDDIPLARHVGLTTVRVHIADLGAQAMHWLIDAIEGGGGSGDALQSVDLVVRASTGKPV